VGPQNKPELGKIVHADATGTPGTAKKPKDKTLHQASVTTTAGCFFATRSPALTRIFLGSHGFGHKLWP
jgi:hypothetical protein